MNARITIPALLKSTRIAALAVTASLLLGACAGVGNNVAEAPTISKERITEIVASPDRSTADRGNDDRRKPELMLAFIGIRPGMVALDLNAGGGYTTELLARAVGPAGRVYGQSAPRDPNHPSTRRTTPEALAERLRNPAAGNIVSVEQRFEDPAPAAVAVSGLDLVTFMFNYHDLGFQNVDRAKLNRAIFAALKPGGIYVIADHAGRPGTGISEAATLHRIEETFLRAEVEAAGFTLMEEGNFLRNPADPRDQETPSQPKDEFVLKFVKP